jgi:hypothetical protein
LTWLPEPVPVARLAPELQASAAALIKADSSGTYAPFAVTEGYAPDFSHAPSGNGKQTRAAAEKAAQRKMPVASQIRALVTCQECNKPRAVHCTMPLKKLQQQQPEGKSANYVCSQLDIVTNDDCVYACGASLFPAEHTLSKWLFCNTQLSCARPIETTLYSISPSTAKVIDFDKNICSACGRESVPNAVCKEQGCLRGAPRHWSMFPLCQSCAAGG